MKPNCTVIETSEPCGSQFSPSPSLMLFRGRGAPRPRNNINEGEGENCEPQGSEVSMTVQFGFMHTQIRMELPPGGSFDPDPQNSLEKPKPEDP